MNGTEAQFGQNMVVENILLGGDFRRKREFMNNPLPVVPSF